MKLELIPFAKYLTLNEESMHELKVIYCMAKWDGKVLGWDRTPLERLKYIEVFTIRNWFKKNDLNASINAVRLSYKLTEQQVLNANSFEIVRAIEAIIKDLNTLLKRETDFLKYPEDGKYSQAAGDRLQKFELYNVLDAVTNKDRTKWEWAKNLNYITVFTILHKNCVEAHVEADYRRLIKLRK